MNPEQILRKRLDAIGFFDEIPKPLKIFCKNIRNKLRNEEDEVIGLTGYPGVGKSNNATVIGLLIDYNYSFEKNVCFIPTSKEIKDMYLGLPMYSVLHIDEASRGMHKQQWHDKLQQTLNTLYDTDREDHYLCSILLMPRFQNFTENFRNFRIKYWVNVIARGIAIFYIKDEDKDCKDPWHIDDNYKIKQKSWRKQIFERQINDIIEMEQKTKNYFFWCKIPKIPEDIWSEYQGLKKQSRVDAKDKEEELNVESYKDRLNNEKIAKWKKIKELKELGHTHGEIGAEIGCAAETIRRNLRAMEDYSKMKGDDNFRIKKKINKEIPKELDKID